MLIAIFLFSLLVIFALYKILCKERYKTIEKPIWKKLIYWAVMLFISMIFSALAFSVNNSTYKLSSYFNRDTLELIAFVILSCMIIQLLSPSVVLYRKIYEKLMKNKIKESSDHKTSANSNFSKDFQEKDFELLLNTLCWLSFSFIILIYGFYIIILWLQGYNKVNASFQNLSTNYDGLIKQLNDISSIWSVLALSIALRQIIFYLNRLRNHSDVSNRNMQQYSIQYDKYLLARKKLSQSHKRL
jgi:hypothetical protein